MLLEPLLEPLRAADMFDLLSGARHAASVGCSSGFLSAPAARAHRRPHFRGLAPGLCSIRGFS